MEKKKIILALIIILIIAFAGVLAYNIYNEQSGAKLKETLTNAAMTENELTNTMSQLKNYTENPNAEGAEQLSKLINQSQSLISEETEYLKTADTQTSNETEKRYIQLQINRLSAVENIINNTNDFSIEVNKYVTGEISLPDLIIATSNLKNSIEDNEKIYKDICSNIKTVLEENPELVKTLNETNATEGMYGEFNPNLIEIE